MSTVFKGSRGPRASQQCSTVFKGSKGIARVTEGVQGTEGVLYKFQMSFGSKKYHQNRSSKILEIIILVVRFGTSRVDLPRRVPIRIGLVQSLALSSPACQTPPFTSIFHIFVQSKIIKHQYFEKKRNLKKKN